MHARVIEKFQCPIVGTIGIRWWEIIKYITKISIKLRKKTKEANATTTVAQQNIIGQLRKRIEPPRKTSATALLPLPQQNVDDSMQPDDPLEQIFTNRKS